jgi:hypothetical protein
MRRQKTRKNAVAIKLEIDHLSSLDQASLRTVWRATFKRECRGLPRGILLRMLAWQIQERAFGGYDRATEKALDRYAGPVGGMDGAGRHLKSGTVLVREYQGSRHTVTVMQDGFAWQERTYPNLSKIAQAITGVKWNGPRFFGLRQAKGGKPSEVEARP